MGLVLMRTEATLRERRVSSGESTVAADTCAAEGLATSGVNQRQRLPALHTYRTGALCFSSGFLKETAD